MEKEKIGKYIRKKRIEKGMTQQQLAEKIQVTEKAVSRWETGREMCIRDRLYRYGKTKP